MWLYPGFLLFSIRLFNSLCKACASPIPNFPGLIAKNFVMLFALFSPLWTPPIKTFSGMVNEFSFLLASFTVVVLLARGAGGSRFNTKAAKKRKESSMTGFLVMYKA